MKFGESFYHQSVPEWSTYNVDYNDLKALVKRRTTIGNGQAQTSPGKENEIKVLNEFEEQLFNELADQHARVNLFVHSKSGEVKRKLTDLQRRIEIQNQRVTSRGGKVTYRQLEVLSKLEDQTLAVGEEIRALRQFVAANREAFRKLLKKYKKWTDSSGLAERVQRHVLDHRSAIANWRYDILLSQHIEALAAIREALNPSARPVLESGRHKSRKKISSIPSSPGTPFTDSDRLARLNYESAAAYLDSLSHGRSHVELDTALATTPLEAGTRRAVYWVHPDHVLEAQLIILRYASIRSTSKHYTAAESPRSSISSHSGSLQCRTIETTNATGIEVGLIMCDDLEKFAARQNRDAIGISETAGDDAPEKAAASIRYSPSQEILLAIDQTTENTPESLTWPKHDRIRLAKFKRGAVGHLFDGSSDEDCPTACHSTQSKQAHKWLEDHREIQPLIQLRYKRSQYTGVRNNEQAGLWISLDTDVRMTRCNKASIRIKDDSSVTLQGGAKDHWQKFPNAILEIRSEGDYSTEFCQLLEESRLAIRVHGFSLETHAVALLCKPSGLRAPHWLSLAEKNIYRLPQPPLTSIAQGSSITFFQRNSPQLESSSDPSTRNDKASDFSNARGESSATSVPVLPKAQEKGSESKKKKPIPKRRVMPSKELADRQRPQVKRYWNEYDDGSEGESAQPYAIFVDPNDTELFPGTAKISHFAAAISKKIRASNEKAYDWFGASTSKEGPNEGERQPLIDDSLNPPTYEESSESENDSPSTLKRNYLTLPTHDRLRPINRNEIVLFRCCVGWLTASLLLTIAAATLLATSKRRTMAQIDVGVVVAVASSLVFAILGIGSMLARRDALGWIHRSIVTSSFVALVLADAALLYGISHGLG